MHLLWCGNFNGHFLTDPRIISSQCIGRMSIRSSEVRTYDQQLRTFQPSGTKLFTKLIDEMSGSTQIFNGRDSVWKYLFLENPRHFVLKKCHTVCFTTVIQPLNMHMTVNKAWHQGLTLALDHLCTRNGQRIRRNGLDQTFFNIYILMF